MYETVGDGPDANPAYLFTRLEQDGGFILAPSIAFARKAELLKYVRRRARRRGIGVKQRVVGGNRDEHFIKRFDAVLVTSFSLDAPDSTIS